MKRTLLLSVTILMLSITIGFSRSDLAIVRAAEIKPEKTKVTVGVSLDSATFLPVYLAIDQGLFRQEGLAVELVTFGGGSDLIKGVVSGSIDIGYSGLASLNLGIDAEQKMKVFYAGNNPVEFYWYAVPKIKSLAEAKGARIGITRYGSSTDFMTRYALKAKGFRAYRVIKSVLDPVCPES